MRGTVFLPLLREENTSKLKFSTKIVVTLPHSKQCLTSSEKLWAVQPNTFTTQNASIHLPVYVLSNVYHSLCVFCGLSQCGAHVVSLLLYASYTHYYVSGVHPLYPLERLGKPTPSLYPSTFTHFTDLAILTHAHNFIPIRKELLGLL